MATMLIRFCADYADEFYVYGFALCTEAWWTAHMDSLASVGWPQEVYFGTNESIEYHNAADYRRAFEVTSISQEDAATLWRLFPLDESDECPAFGHVLFIEPESEDEDDE